ncbi:5098_t:CDS:2 [Ambispora gerdemannii]|uniref:5098_t:CDS:1 n=1 Tax=Ambispora gerdemannii TaxID=144530 RepID=A0A9N9G1V6_9GLOM|nr:5098_t:CDS:2 [Ambispora gerdemannii]
MSFDISWEKLDQQVAQNVQDLLNNHFRNTNNKPSFMGDIEISEFDFGTMPPAIEIIDVTEPFPEFYLPDEEVEEARSETDLLGNEEAEQHFSELYHRTEEEEDIVLKKDTDAQVHISLSYQGNIRMTVSTELRMNYPNMMFMSLPIRLTVTGFNFSGDLSFHDYYYGESYFIVHYPCTTKGNKLESENVKFSQQYNNSYSLPY